MSMNDFLAKVARYLESKKEIAAKNTIVKRGATAPASKKPAKRPEVKAGRSLSFDRLFKLTQRLDGKNLTNRTKIAKIAIHKKWPGGFIAETVTADPGKVVRKYKSEIAPADPKHEGKIKGSTAIRCSCSCPRFLFMWEYALHQRNAAPIRYSNGEPPIEKNPSLIPGACKHLYRMMLYMTSKRLISYEMD